MKKRLIVLAALFVVGGAVAATLPGNTVAVHRATSVAGYHVPQRSGHW